jgi:uncharacterized protein (TIGR02246 family)
LLLLRDRERQSSSVANHRRKSIDDNALHFVPRRPGSDWGLGPPHLERLERQELLKKNDHLSVTEKKKQTVAEIRQQLRRLIPPDDRYTPIRSRVMKHLLPLVSLLAISGQISAQENEVDELQDFVKQYEETWQSHDAGLLGDFFADDSDMIVGIQPRIVGREAIAAWWNEYFSRIDSGRLLSVSIESIRLLGPDIALINVATTTGGTHSETNEILESRKARGTWVVTREGGEWKISALRAHSPVGELREAPGTDK